MKARSSDSPRLKEAERWLCRAGLPHTVAVGWSGGADSTALLLALRSLGHEVQAWHVDHAWHEASASYAAHLGRRAEAWGIPFCSARMRMPPRANRESVSRQARLNQFEMWGRERGVETLCLAHHLEDQAETVCLRMLQGAGVAGLRGMAAARRHGGLQLRRPLLHVHRRELRSALRAAGVDWLDDPSNADIGLLRNRIRHRLFPAISRTGCDPVLLFLRWQQQAVQVYATLAELADGIALYKRSGGVSVAWDEWCVQPLAVRAIVLQRMAAALMGAGVVLGRRHIHRIERWCEGGARGGLDLSRCRISRQHGRLNLLPRRVSLR